MIPKYLTGYALAGAALCAVLTGCTSPEAPAYPDLPEQTQSEPLDPAVGLGEGDVYLAAARAVAPTLETVADTDLRGLGQSVCGAFDAGVSTGEVGATMIESGLTATESGAVVGAATSTLCPEHGDAARGQ